VIVTEIDDLLCGLGERRFGRFPQETAARPASLKGFGPDGVHPVSRLEVSVVPSWCPGPPPRLGRAWPAGLRSATTRCRERRSTRRWCRRQPPQCGPALQELARARRLRAPVSRDRGQVERPRDRLDAHGRLPGTGAARHLRRSAARSGQSVAAARARLWERNGSSDPPRAAVRRSDRYPPQSP